MYGSKRLHTETSSMNLMDVSPATDLAVLLFASDLKVNLPSAHAWDEQQLQEEEHKWRQQKQLQQQHQQDEQGLQGQQQQQKQDGKQRAQQPHEQQKQQEFDDQQQQKQQDGEQGEQAQADFSCPRPDWLPAAEATLLEGFMVYKFPAAEHLDAVLQLRQHLQTLLRIQVAGGGLQAQGFSESISRVLCGLLEGGGGGGEREGVLGVLKGTLEEAEREGGGKAESERLEKELRELEEQQQRKRRQRGRQGR